MLNHELLEITEEFLDLIVNEENDDELRNAMESLHEFLERDVDGWTCHPGEELCEAVRSRAEDIWDLISEKEIAANSQLEDYFNGVIETVESALERIDSDESERLAGRRGGYEAYDEDHDDYERQQNLYGESDEEDDYEEDYEEEEE